MSVSSSQLEATSARSIMKHQITLTTKRTTVLLIIVIVILSEIGAWAQDDEGREPLGPSQIESLAWSPDGTMIAVGEGPDVCGPIHIIRILGAVGLQELKRFEEHRCIINSLAWSPDSGRLASSDDEGIALVWNVATGQVVTTAEGVLTERRIASQSMV